MPWKTAKGRVCSISRPVRHRHLSPSRLGYSHGYPARSCRRSRTSDGMYREIASARDFSSLVARVWVVGCAARLRPLYRARGEPDEKASQLSGSPDASPTRNQRTRSADVPWVKESGAT